jgi:glutamate-1-semialdehyde 2,1-aminomutase
VAVSTTSRELRERARHVLPGGSINNWRMHDEMACAMRQGAGGHIFDYDGNEYVDFVLGSGPGILGHCHPAVVRALEAQIAAGTQFYTLTEPTIELAELLVDGLPHAELVKFTSSGAEATFQALRLARATTGREKIMRFKGAYHGHHDYAQSGTSDGIPHAVSDLVVTGTYNDADGACELIEQHRGELAAVIVEPFQRTIPPRDGFLAALRRATSEHGVLLIFDELVTGFRIAWGGGQERYGVTPDLATYGKILGGGLPLGAVAGPRDIMDRSSSLRAKSEFVAISGTLNGNPLATSAGLATLTTLKAHGTYERLAETGTSLVAGFHELVAKTSLPLQVLGDHMLMGLSFGNGDPFDPRTFQSGDAALRDRLEIGLFKRGVFVNLAAKFYLSTQHDQADVDRTLDALEATLAEIEET